MTSWGPKVLPEGRARFQLWAPDLDAVALELMGRPAQAMQAEGDGWFALETDAGPGTRYRFRVAEGLAVPDPASRQQDGGVHGWSVLTDLSTHAWRHPDWRGRPWEETVLYEAHVGLFEGFNGLSGKLPELADLGVTAVELMPIAAFAGSRNWGYDGVLPYAPSEDYGTPDELMALIDRAHGLGLMVFLDVVYNHFGPEGNYLGSYAGPFFDSARQTPWGGAVAVERPEVAGFFVDNALMWLRDYRFDGLRFDAVHAIDNVAFLDRMGEAIRVRLGEDRHIHLVLENEHNDAQRLAGAYDAQLNDDFHHVIHVMLTGESDGYYGAFQDDLAGKLARSLQEGFVYQGEPSPVHDGQTRGTPTTGLPVTAFVDFIQNHDQVGNRAFGDRLLTLADPRRVRVAAALMLLSPSIPMIFMGEEDGSRAPFLFFTDFENGLADAVREGRRQEFARFAAFADPERRAAIPDPNALSTFRRSLPVAGDDAQAWRGLYRHALALRHRELVPHLSGTKPAGATVLGPAAVAVRWRLGDGALLSLAVNLGVDPAPWRQRPADPPLFELEDPQEGPGLTLWLQRP